MADISKKMEMSLDDIIKLNSAKSKPAAPKPGPPAAKSNMNNSKSKQGGPARAPLKLVPGAAARPSQARQAPKNLANARGSIAKRAPIGVTGRIMQLRQRMSNQLALRARQQAQQQRRQQQQQQQRQAPKLASIPPAGRGGGRGRGPAGANRGVPMSQRVHQQRANASAQRAPIVQRGGRGAGRGRGRLTRAPVVLNRTVGSGVRKAQGAPRTLVNSGSAVLNRQMTALQQQQQQQLLAQKQRLAAKGLLGRGSQAALRAPIMPSMRQQQQQQQQQVLLPVRQQQALPRQQTIIRGKPGLLPQEAMLREQQRQLAAQQRALEQRQRALATLQRQQQQQQQQQQRSSAVAMRGGGAGGKGGLRAPVLQYQQPQQIGQGGGLGYQVSQMRQEPSLVRLGVSHGGMGGAAAPIQLANGRGGGRGRGRGGRRGGY
ncbi:hypothetical protein DUNSADRAFT_10531 [Dunaliella salina]|uniref:Uncharacterized protein n=1 Tax=Dunaliella salina TaxID=3046 RepID=A0ABQ7GF40_DUNSA|nr:hypothetical protein DUNSADRAFT_10531 [Dunaliella salina]|eukprot:KAF5833216.1 hypothetical protein DUNSADRAFT_10531 [Dunaliella salina]